MFLVEIDGVRVLYTGDYSTEKERLILPAEIPEEKIDVLIVESTFGTCNHKPRKEREVTISELRISEREGKNDNQYPQRK